MGCKSIWGCDVWIETRSTRILYLPAVDKIMRISRHRGQESNGETLHIRHKTAALKEEKGLGLKVKKKSKIYENMQWRGGTQGSKTQVLSAEQEAQKRT